MWIIIIIIPPIGCFGKVARPWTLRLRAFKCFVFVLVFLKPAFRQEQQRFLLTHCPQAVALSTILQVEFEADGSLQELVSEPSKAFDGGLFSLQTLPLAWRLPKCQAPAIQSSKRTDQESLHSRPDILYQCVLEGDSALQSGIIDKAVTSLGCHLLLCYRAVRHWGLKPEWDLGDSTDTEESIQGTAGRLGRRNKCATWCHCFESIARLLQFGQESPGVTYWRLLSRDHRWTVAATSSFACGDTLCSSADKGIGLEFFFSQ